MCFKRDYFTLIINCLVKPLCLLLTCWQKKKTTAPALVPRRIVFLKCIEQGAWVAALPALQRLKDLAGEENVFIAVFKSVANFFSAVDVIDIERIFIIDDSSVYTIIRDFGRLRSWITKNEIDGLIDAEGLSLLSALFLRYIPIAAKIGFVHPDVPGRYAAGLTHQIEFIDEHISLQFMRLVLAATGQADMQDTKLSLPKLTIITHTTPLPSESAGRPLIMINPNVNDFLMTRKWPLNNYAILAKKLLHETDAFIILIGRSSERDTASTLFSSITPQLQTRIYSAIGKTSFTQLCGLLQTARLLITSDSGPAHFAALFQMPSVILFGPESPARYAPLNPNAICLQSNTTCSPCLSPYNDRLCRCKDNKCVKSISVDEVFKAAIAIL